MNIILEKPYSKNKYTSRVLFLIFLSLALFFLMGTFFKAEASIIVTPTRLILENGERSATIRLINREDEQSTYRISFINRRMTEEGGFENIELPESREQRLESYLAQDLVRYSPRQVVLPPNRAQVVRIQLMIPPDLKEGEYRSHLLFQEIPELVQQSDNEEDNEISISINAIYGISIPIIIRNGETAAEVEISDLNFNNQTESNNSELSFIINRTGNQSIYGDIEVLFIPEQGDELLVGAVRGTAVYTDVEERKYNISLNNNVELENGVLKVIYSSKIEKEGIILAERELEI